MSEEGLEEASDRRRKKRMEGTGDVIKSHKWFH